MAKHMKLWVVGALLLAVGGAVVASNMGFKFVPNITTANFDYTVSLPINNNYTDANSVFTDLQGSGCSPVRLQRIVPSAGSKTKQTWGLTGGTNFPISKGEGYIAVTSAACTTWVVVGSHDPAYTYNISSGLDTLVAIPYHTTAQTANDLFTSIPNCTRIQRIVPSAGSKTKQTWGLTGGTNFNVTIGEAYVVLTSANATWTPAHY